MLLVTHLLASTATIILITNLIKYDHADSILYIILGTMLSNILIDIYGHNNVNNQHNNIKSRRSVLHSVTGVLFITMVTLTLIVLMSNRVSLVDVTVLIVANIMHLILDFVTSEGIYVRGKPRSLSYIRYDDPKANALVSAFSLAVILFYF